MSGPSRTPSRASSVVSLDTLALASPNAALLGATSAFTRPVAHARAPSNTYVGSDGALRAANAAGSSSHTPVKPSGPAGPYVNRTNNKHGVKGSGLVDGKIDGPPPTTSAESPLRPEPPAPIQRQGAKSPSHHAALSAAAHAPPIASVGQREANARPRAKTVQRPAAPPKPRRLSQRFNGADTEDRDKPTDETPIPSTPTLVNLFERKSSVSGLPGGRRPPPEPVVIAPSPDLSLKSPKPIRTSAGGITTLFQMEFEKSIDANKSSRVDTPKEQPETRVWDPNTRSFRPEAEVRQFERKISAARRQDAHRSPERPSTVSPKAFNSTKSPLPIRKANTGFPALRVQRPAQSQSTAPQRRQGSLSPLHHASTEPININTAMRPPSAPRERISPLSAQSTQSFTATYHQLYSHKSTPSMTGDQLANAMVASSLASTRTSPRPLSKVNSLPPPPPTTRRHKHKLTFSRTPSPTKTGMLQTLRRTSPQDSDSEDELHPYSKHKKDKHRLVRKHPNKHHEGDRKRWRDAVTERERKRYEGVWAANKGLHCSFTPDEQAYFSREPESQRTRDTQTAALEQVSNVVARDIWSRSRLPDSTLEAVWDLVDNDAAGRLWKVEFVVGMWLVDQRLKGRKLPVRVSESVWASVKGLQGIKVRKTIK